MSIKLRDYQVNLTNNIYNLWQSGFKNVLAVSPTGSGKAFTLCNLAKDLVFKHGRPTVILVHRKELVSQLCMSLATLEVPHNIIAQKGTVLGTVNEQKRLHGKSYYNHASQVTVVSVDTLLSREARYKDWAARQKVWILDEAAHLLKTNKWGKTIDLFGSDVLGVGFTATPQRLDRKGLGSHAFGMFDVMTEGPTVKWLIENGFLSKYKIVEPKSDYRDHLVDNGSSTTDYTLKARENASLKSHLVGDIVTNYMKFADGMQTIVFADSIMAGSRIEEEFKRSGIKAKLLHGDTPSGERSLGVREFAENKIQVLVNVDLFSEGFDVYPLPGRRIVECVILARPTKSLSLYLQSCLDTETEILTKRGWLKYNEINYDDMVPAFNSVTEQVEWCELEDIIIRDRLPSEKMYKYESPHLNFRITEDHDVIYRTRGANKKWLKRTGEETYKLKSLFNIPVSAEESVVDNDLTDDDLKFIGWFMSDGYINKRTGVTVLTQSMKNKHHVDEIRDLLNRLNYEFGEHHHKRTDSTEGYDDIVTFNIPSHKPAKKQFIRKGRWLNGRMPPIKLFPWLNKTLPDCYESISSRQWGVVLETWNKGNGSKQKNLNYKKHTMTICMGDNYVCSDRLQSILVRRGYRCNLSVDTLSKNNLNDFAQTKKDIFYLRILKKNYTTVAGSNVSNGSISGKKYYIRTKIIEETNYVPEKVWCVKNRLGSIFIRRNGVVSITGNCGRALRPHKDKPHAIIIDHVGNRKFHGLPDRVHKWTLDNIVKKRDSTNLHKVCGNVECCLPYDRWLSECPYCGYVEPKFNRTREVTAREALKVVDGDMELLDPETIRELENEMNLESPDDVARRVGFAAGEIAAKSAHKKQRERIEAQKELAETIALWAGREKLKGYTDRQIRKRFMIEFGEGITVMLSMPRKDMIEFNELIKKGM